MRKRISILVQLALFVGSQVSTASEQMPKEQLDQLVSDITTHYCGDQEFLKCVSFGYDQCAKEISTVLYQCDFNPVWIEFKRLDAEGKSILPNKENDKYLSCVSYKLKDMGQCTIERDDRLMGKSKENESYK